MRHTLIIAVVVLSPLMASAVEYSKAPMLMVGGSQPAPSATPVAQPVPGAGLPNFPENAITRVGENTTGQHVDAPPTPADPTNPATPAAGATPATPANPNAPTPPANPINKLWPKDTIQIFMPPCTALRPRFIEPCMCTITKLMLAMPHDEFLKKSEDGTVENDPRLKQIRTECATAPEKKE